MVLGLSTLRKRWYARAVTRPDEPSRAPRLVTVVGAAYLVQGIVAGIGLLLLGALAQTGTPLEQQVGILAGGAIPWLLKFGGAVLLDLMPSWPLRVRGWVIGGLQAGAAACVWALASSWGDLHGLALAWVALNFTVALQDVLVDALALDTLAQHRSWTATAMGFGHALGAGLLAPLIIQPYMGEHGMAAGLRLPVAWLLALALVPALALWLPDRPARARSQAPAARELTREDWLGGAWALLVFAALMFGANATSAIISEFLINHLEWDWADVAAILMPIGAIMGLLGALAAGPMVARLGPARATMIISAALGLAWLSFATASSSWHVRSVVVALAIPEAALQAALLVGLHALALRLAARAPLPTTAFVLAMAALNLPRVLAPMLAPKLLLVGGFVGVFAACGAFQCLSSLGLWPWRRDVRP